MTPVRSLINQYRGVNAHLHSSLQNEGGWGGFHTRHIVHLADTLNLQLRSMGYIASVEESFQIRRMSDGVRPYKADTLIVDRNPTRSFSGGSGLQAHTVPLLELFSDENLSEKPFRAIAIDEFDPETLQRGEPVAWIELLSPTNKGSSEDALAYRSKRMDVIRNGLVFVEIDYLHETPPTYPTLEPYIPSRKQPRQLEAHPYWIMVIDPRPRLEDGQAQVIPIDVDAPLPTVELPLNGGDVLMFDFGKPYRKTFEEGFLGDQVDYSRLPISFNHYRPADQTRIALRTLAVVKAQRGGVDLETGPFPVENLPLEEALRQLEGLKPD